MSELVTRVPVDFHELERLGWEAFWVIDKLIRHSVAIVDPSNPRGEYRSAELMGIQGTQSEFDDWSGYLSFGMGRLFFRVITHGE